MIQNLRFRVELIKKEIEKFESELGKNNEFIKLFHKNNIELTQKIKKSYDEINKIYYELDSKGHVNK